ncbi:MAG TPA: hypothetical protein VFK13_04950 [Gemmatimonadaceae bacterium]|nr:hypothetical protein [Gemmatimonadaceae bacterium]
MSDPHPRSIEGSPPKALADATELSEDDLEHVVGGLARAWSEHARGMPALDEPAWTAQPIVL